MPRACRSKIVFGARMACRRDTYAQRMQRTKGYYPKSILTLATKEEVNEIIAYLSLHGLKKPNLMF